jgi:hypothetical protein
VDEEAWVDTVGFRAGIREEGKGIAQRSRRSQRGDLGQWTTRKTNL